MYVYNIKFENEIKTIFTQYSEACLNINKQSLATMGTYNVKNSDVSGQEHLDKMVAGEIAYQYFNNSQYTDKQGTADIMDNMYYGMLVQDKIKS